MSKLFDGILLVSDIDGTLIGEVWEVSRGNLEAIRYFQENGGTFTVATGRLPFSIRLINPGIPVNAPVICHNGAVIYDMEADKILWQLPLGNEGVRAVQDIRDKLPFTGIEIYNENKIYICRKNPAVHRQLAVERFAFKDKSVEEVPQPWSKVLFVQEKEQMRQLRSYIADQPYAEEFAFMQSADNFYEMLHRDASKGYALQQLRKMLPGIHTAVAVGDNENDMRMIQAADISYATDNAYAPLKKLADHVTVDCRSDAIKQIIVEIEQNLKKS